MKTRRPALPPDTPPWAWYMIGLQEAQSDRAEEVLEELRAGRREAAEDRRQAADDRKEVKDLVRSFIVLNNQIHRAILRSDARRTRAEERQEGLLRAILHTLRIGLNSRGHGGGNSRPVR